MIPYFISLTNTQRTIHLQNLNLNPRAMNLALVDSPSPLNDQDKQVFATSTSATHALEQWERVTVTMHLVQIQQIPTKLTQ